MASAVPVTSAVPQVAPSMGMGMMSGIDLPGSSPEGYSNGSGRMMGMGMEPPQHYDGPPPRPRPPGMMGGPAPHGRPPPGMMRGPYGKFFFSFFFVFQRFILILFFSFFLSEKNFGQFWEFKFENSNCFLRKT